MRKSLLALAIVIVLILSMTMFVACIEITPLQDKPTNIPSACPHLYSHVCDTTCDVCGQERSVSHKIVAISDAHEPTCTQDGNTAGKKCSLCGLVIEPQASIPAHGHNEVTIPGKDPTCSEHGVTEGKRCSICGEILVAQEVINTLEHNIVVDEAVEATCTKLGKTEGKHCADCGEVLIDQYDVPMLEHTLGEWVVDSEPTCTQDGHKHQSCTVCHGTINNDPIPATGHTHSDWIVDSEPTCTQAGSKHIECTVCRETINNETILATGHTLGEWVVDSEPTCTQEGSKHQSCTVCHETINSQTIPAIDHTYGSEWYHDNNGHWHKCSVCGQDSQHEDHSLDSEFKCECGFGCLHSNEVDVVKVPATCLEAGHEAGKKCADCGTIISGCEPIEALGHDLTHHDAQAPTCTEIGWNAYDTCSRCDYTTYNELEALGHTHSDWIVDSNATCTQDGSKHIECTVCHETLESGTIDKLGHDLTHHDGQASTCTENGWDAYDTCSRCDYTTYHELEAPGHNEVIDEAVAPTCTETGLTEGKHCSVCGEVLVKQDVVDKLGHIEVVDEAVAPTCSKTGLSEGKHCDRCNEVLVAQTTVDKLPHTEVVDPAVEPTCTETGLTEGKYCSVCDEVIVAQTVVPATGHTLDDNYHCTVCDKNMILAKADSINVGDVIIFVYESSKMQYGGISPDSYGTGIEYTDNPAITHTITVKKGNSEGTFALWSNDEGKYLCYTGSKNTLQLTDTLDNSSSWIISVDNGNITIKNANATERFLQWNSSSPRFACYKVTSNMKSIQAYKFVACDCDSSVENVERVEPTCVSVGHEAGTRCTLCGKTTGLAEIPATGEHNYSDWTVDRVATCTTEGEQHRNCTVCEHEDSSSIEMLSHTYSEEWTLDASNHWHKCENCDAISDKAEHSYGEDNTCVCGKNLGCTHDNVERVERVEATCSKAGIAEHYKCSCGAVFTTDMEEKTIADFVLPVNPDNHENIVAVGEAKDATCTEAGITAGEKCADCGTVIKEQTEVPAPGHTEVIDKAVEATCTEAGKTEGKHCSVCKEVIVEQTVVPATGHTLDDKYHCTVCDKNMILVKADSINVGDVIIIVCDTKNMQYDGISSTSTTYGKGVAYTGAPAIKYTLTVEEGSSAGTFALYSNEEKAYLCLSKSENALHSSSTVTDTSSWTIIFDDNGNILITNKKYDTRVLKWNPSATRFACYTSGQTAIQAYKLIACDCEETVENVDRVEPTCASVGHEAGTRCTLCGKTTGMAEIPATGEHNYGDWIVDRVATCTQEGSKHRNCTVCEHEESSSIAMVAHTYSEEWTLNESKHWHKCENCDAICDEAEHSYDADNTCVCGKIYGCTHVDDNLTPVDKVVATCSKEGTMAHYVCSCGAVLTLEKVETTLEDLVLPVNPDNHENELKHVSNGNKTHNDVYECCNTTVTENVACVDNDGNDKCDACGGDTVLKVATFEFGANGAASHSDGSSLSAVKNYIEGDHTLTIVSPANVYINARDAIGNSCLKIGTSKAGSCEFSVDDDVNMVTIYIAGYKANTAKVKINGVSYEISTQSNNGEYTAIEIDTSTNKTITFTTLSGGYRCMINTIEYYA